MQVTVKGIQDLVELNATGREIYPLAVKLCESVLKQTPYNGQYMCPGFVSAYGIPVSKFWRCKVLEKGFRINFRCAKINIQ